MTELITLLVKEAISLLTLASKVKTMTPSEVANEIARIKTQQKLDEAYEMAIAQGEI